MVCLLFFSKFRFLIIFICKIKDYSIFCWKIPDYNKNISKNGSELISDVHLKLTGLKSF
jgi:hypothetical protein